MAEEGLQLLKRLRIRVVGTVRGGSKEGSEKTTFGEMVAGLASYHLGYLDSERHIMELLIVSSQNTSYHRLILAFRVTLTGLPSTDHHVDSAETDRATSGQGTS